MGRQLHTGVEDVLTMAEHCQAIYNGKTVLIDYVPKKAEFKTACMRIIDNCADGIVETPDGKRYAINRNSRMAKLIK
jgi:hypothetical protein